MPAVNTDFNRTCARLDLDPERSGVFTPGVARVSFTDASLRRFNECAARVAPGTPPLDARQIAAATRRLSRAIGTGRESRFIQARMRRAGEIRVLLDDGGWTVEDKLCERMLQLVDYIDNEGGLIPDDVPVIGGLDDALLVDLAMEGLRGELDEYADFCRYRMGEAARLGATPAAVTMDRACWSEQRAEELRLERVLRRARGTAYAGDVGAARFQVG
ncbi:hypothetical protein [Rhodanobacter sp. B05]|uniref:hypothetical protein n=1 Tax=Rhodanobacter sp. B05 TaxID=1945859 RepID=UPI001115A749|nr:hypothetical protein [Rhodanobacter sp. B05]